MVYKPCQHFKILFDIDEKQFIIIHNNSIDNNSSKFQAAVKE